jgi:hypothetical protein
MSSTNAASYLDDTAVHQREGLVDALDAFGGILIGVLAGSAAWLAILAVALILL